jgi:hypothetical protein
MVPHHSSLVFLMVPIESSGMEHDIAFGSLVILYSKFAKYYSYGISTLAMTLNTLEIICTSREFRISSSEARVGGV